MSESSTAEDAAVAEGLADQLADFYSTLSPPEQKLLTGVVWRNLSPLERVGFSPDAADFNEAELLLLQELDQ